MEANTEYPGVNEDATNKDALNMDYPSLMSHQHSSKELDLDYSKFTAITESEFLEFADENLKIQDEDAMTGIKIHIEEAVSKGSGIQKYTAFFIKGEDEKGAFEVFRRYSEFDTLRSQMVDRWPGCYVPAIPSKQLIGKTDSQTTLNRIRFLNQFLKKLSTLSYLYYGQEFQVFIRSSEADVTKSLQKLKRETFDVLLKKYQDAFTDCIDAKDQLNENIQRVQLFETFVKNNRPVVIEYRKQARSIAEARQSYDDKLGMVFDRILPGYEEGSMMEYTSGDESKSIFMRIHEFEGLAGAKNKYQQAAKQNPYWLIYDLLKFQEREMEAIQDSFKGLQKIADKIEDASKDIASNIEEIQNLEAGKTTLRSLITKGTNQTIIAKLKTDNQQLQKQKAIMIELQSIVADYINKQVINQFKLTRQRFYNKALKKTFAYDMFYVHNATLFYEELKQISQKRIDGFEMIDPEKKNNYSEKTIDLVSVPLSMVQNAIETHDTANTHDDD